MASFNVIVRIVFMYNVSKIIDEQANVGEGPLWDDENQVLYWADIRSGRLFKYNPETNEKILMAD